MIFTRRPRAWLGLCVMGIAVALGLGGSFGSAEARAKESPHAVISDVQLSDLPTEARETRRLIDAGGPFPTTKDGVVFGNRERILPRQPRGFYREYTVPTPGSRDRGARRIVCGGSKPTKPETCYYSNDHYASFRRIVA